MKFLDVTKLAPLINVFNNMSNQIPERIYLQILSFYNENKVILENWSKKNSSENELNDIKIKKKRKTSSRSSSKDRSKKSTKPESSK